MNQNINYPHGLPRLAQDFSPEQRAAVVTWLSSLPLDELRQRQTDLRARVIQSIASPHTIDASDKKSLTEKTLILTDAVMAVLLANMADAGLTVKQNSGPLA